MKVLPYDNYPFWKRKSGFRKIPVYLTILFSTLSYSIQAQPDMANKLTFNDFVVYRDAKVPGRFYYLPGDLHIATNNEGMPDFKLLLMRYTGTRAYDDQGSHRFRNLLQMRIVLSSPAAESLTAVKQKLKAYTPSPELRVFPIKNLKTVLVWSAITQSDTTEDPASNQDGYFSQDSDDNLKNEYWKERNFVIRLDNETADMFWNAFQEQQTVLSVGFAFYSEVYNSQKTDLSVSGTAGAVNKLNKIMLAESERTKADTILDTRVIKAGAFEILIDTKKWPDLIKKVDINEQIPPDYAAINIYCYDFNNEIREDLAQKKIEIEATGVGRGNVTMKYTFRKDSPDIYAYDMKFPYAVRIDIPYRYRITEIAASGTITRSEWITGRSWHEILDITTKSDN